MAFGESLYCAYAARLMNSRSREQHRRYVEAERPSGREIAGNIELSRLFDRYIGSKYLARASPQSRKVRPVRYQPTHFDGVPSPCCRVPPLAPILKTIMSAQHGQKCASVG